MKIIAVVIMMMIILNCTKAIRNTPEKKSCAAKCAPGCIFANFAYPLCFALCLDSCENPDHVHSEYWYSFSYNVNLFFILLCVLFMIEFVMFFIFLTVNFCFSDDHDAVNDAVNS